MKQRLNRQVAVPDDGTQVAPATISGADNLSEGDSFSCELSRDGAAHKAVLMKHANFAHIAGIEPEGHRFSYIGCKRRRNVAQPVEVNTIAMNSAALRHLDQQQIQLFERLGHARQKSIPFPAFGRRRFCLSALTAVVNTQQKVTQQAVQLGQGEPRVTAHAAAGRRVPVQLAQEHLVDGREESFDPAPSSRFPRR